jgi:hypothetical protein
MRHGGMGVFFVVKFFFEKENRRDGATCGRKPHFVLI